MPFIPHTDADVSAMLAAVGVSSIDQLFDEVPKSLRSEQLNYVPHGLSEMAVNRLMQERAAQDGQPLCFAGGGAYEHHIPAAVWELATRGEFYSAYTPYQAEASQGTLQLIYEYQSMITALTAMDVSNASLYDGASGLAEAVLMAVRANRRSKSLRILMPRTVNPRYRKVANAIVRNQQIVLETLDYDATTGVIDPASLPQQPGDFAALVIPQPNYFGALEDMDALTDWAHSHGALVIAVVNPLALGILKAPGHWGQKGADIVCGDGQPMGIPLSSGGPYFGFMCCKQEYVRQMPGRIVGGTVDLDGRPGFALTLQAREQHIRRSKATSNICTNQGLMVTAATIHMSILGAEGLARTASVCHDNLRQLAQRLERELGIKPRFSAPGFHEMVIPLTKPADQVLTALAQADIVGGISLAEDYPELGNALLVCTTETRIPADLDLYVQTLKQVLA